MFGATLLVIRDQARLRWMIPALGAAQLCLHVLLSMTAQTGHAHGDATGVSAIIDLSWQMLTAHATSGVVTALVWHLRRQFIEAIVQWPISSSTLVVCRTVLRSLGHAVRPTARAWLLSAPRRGLPAGPRYA